MTPRTTGKNMVRAPWRWSLLALTVAYAAALRLWLFVGITRLDMLRYIELSNHVLSGGSLFDEQAFYASTRLPLILPMLASHKLLGFGEHVSVAWPFVCSVAAVVAVFFLGRELYDDRVGLLAAFGMAAAPLEVELATQLLPDPVEGLLIVLSVLFGVLAINRDRGWRAWAIASGAALGLAYATRVNALALLPGIVAIGAILKPREWRRSLWSLVGLGGVFLLLAGVFWVFAGDPLADWHRTGTFYSSYKQSGFQFRHDRFWRQFTTQGPLLWFPVILALGTSWALFLKRSRPSWLLLAWAWGFWIYLDFVSPLHGLDPSYRYVEPMVAPALILAAASVWWLSTRLRGPLKVLPIAISLACLLLLLPTSKQLTDRWRGDKRFGPLRKAAQRLKSEDKSLPIYTDDVRHLVALNYYSGFELGRDTLEPADSPENGDARLFVTDERWPESGTGYLWVSLNDRPTMASYTVLMSMPHADGTLRVMRVSPIPQ